MKIGWVSARIFDNVWSGARHALVGPSQVDRFGQTNIAALGGTYEAPKVQLLVSVGSPGNSISHANSVFRACKHLKHVSSLRVSAMWFAPSAITPSVCQKGIPSTISTYDGSLRSLRDGL